VLRPVGGPLERDESVVPFLLEFSCTSVGSFVRCHRRRFGAENENCEIAPVGK
jgi:hypothetical protein